MAAVYPPRQRQTTSFASNSGTTTTPNQPKLRSSCHACASSKLKCSQEKPVCSRCSKRGLICEYFVARRGGRKSNRSDSTKNRSSDVSNTAMSVDDGMQLVHSQPNWTSRSPSISSSSDPMRSPAMMHRSTKSSISSMSSMSSLSSLSGSSSDMMQDFFSSMDSALFPTSTSEGENDLDDFFGTGDFFPTRLDNSCQVSDNLSDYLPMPEDAMSDLLTLPISSSLPKNPLSPGRDMHSHQAIDSSCSCLVKALGIMKQLVPSSSNGCMSQATAHGLDSGMANRTTQSVIIQNEASIEAVSAMLRCSCSQDGYLLAVMALIIFKVLGWYASVARETPGFQSSHPRRSRQTSPSDQFLLNSTFVGSYCLDGADSARMAAQLVLNELHQVRHIVDQLSSKLRQKATKRGRRGGGFETLENLDLLDPEITLPLSPGMYEQLDVDLRRRLKSLSAEMIDRLKRL
jgi:hypothetical protein